MGDYLTEARYDATINIADEVLKGAIRAMKAHGRDPEANGLVAKGIVVALNRLRKNGCPDIWDEVRNLMAAFD